jgi:spore coat protein CotF
MCPAPCVDEVKSMDPVKVRRVNMSDFLESMKRIKKTIAADNLGTQPPQNRQETCRLNRVFRMHRIISRVPV